METTEAVYNNSLYAFVTANGTVQSWARAFVSNLLAHGAQAWSDMFSQFNSGTYNNMWYVHW
jgi:hypothetical protein